MGWVLTRTRNGKERHTASYRDAAGHVRSAGTFDTKKEALAAIQRQEVKLGDGTWIDPAAGPHHVRRVRDGRVAAVAAHRGLHPRRVRVEPASPLRAVLRRDADEQDHALDRAGLGHPRRRRSGLSPRSIGKYHTMLHSIFARAVRDRMIAFNPCAATELPKVVLQQGPHPHARRVRTAPRRDPRPVHRPGPDRDRDRSALGRARRAAPRARRLPAPHHHRAGDDRRGLPQGLPHRANALLVKPYPKDNEARTLARLRLAARRPSASRIAALGLGRHDLLFPSTEAAGGQPLSRATFNTRYWRPAVARAGIDFNVRVHDLRHAHASWLLAGGADLAAVMERMGHAQIMTTQKYLHTLPDADDKALAAFQAIRHRS